MEAKEAGIQRCSVKGILRNFIKFTRKHLRRSLFFNKVAGFTFFHRTSLVAASEANVLLASRAYFYEAKVKFSNICE